MSGTKFLVSAHPHIFEKQDTTSIMRDVLIALLPACFCALWFFGLPVIWLILNCVFCCFFSEYLWNKFLGKDQTIGDLSAIVTGVLLAFCLPPTLPWWMASLGSIFAIIVVKQLFGGLGYNIFNPALAARAMLTASYPSAMTSWIPPFSKFVFFWPKNIQAITQATPLMISKLNLNGETLPTIWQMFLGNTAGSLGETSALALLIGAGYLFYKKVIDGWIPFSFIGTVFILSWLLGKNPVFQIFAGGLILGAFFMATDYVTSPVTKKGKLIFGIGAGILTILIRFYGGYPEGVCYSILLMNLATPFIDIFTRTKPYGYRKIKNDK